METDPPIGLPGRRALLTSLEAMLARASGASVFVMSVDGFGDLVDQRTGSAEDLGLELGARLSRIVRSNDELASLDPGVFALASSGMRQQHAPEVAERLRGVFAVPVEIDGEFISLTVTIGVSHGARRSSAAKLLDAAESDLAARQVGRQ